MFTHGLFCLNNSDIWGPSLSSVGALSRCGGHLSRVRALLVPDFPPGTVGSLLNSIKFCCLSRVEPQKDCNTPVAYGALDGSGDLTKDAIWSECSCRFVCVHMV